ncbi:MAG: AmmeMemoRadiSam system protein B [Candidatus Omnitrophica bacterium]|nr:AmmeMemoRadiSam system protein B [Candidatus Omnitrophota bacterium]
MKLFFRIAFFSLSVILIQNCQPSANPEKSGKIRPSALKGQWYPAGEEALAKQVDDLLQKIPDPAATPHAIRALIAPHAGYAWSGPCAAYAYKPLKGKSFKRVIILAPSHTTHFRGGSIAGFDAYETPLGNVPLDREACDALLKSDHFNTHPEAHTREHSIEIQLPFLQRVLGEFELIPIIISEIDPKDCVEMADLIRPLLGEDALLVMSSDFTHQGPRFGYSPFKENIKENVQRLDFAAVNYILNLDVRGFWSFLDMTRATICGRSPIKIGMMALPRQTQVEFVHYETSGDKTKDYSETVSYCAILFRSQPDYLDESEAKIMLETARKTLEQSFEKEKASEYIPPAGQVTERLKQKKGIFVTLHKKGVLRGCIGHLDGDRPLYRAAADTVLLSAFGDRRFSPLEKNELDEIDIEISVMSPMKSIDSWKEIVLGRDGITLEKKGRSALYLPQVALQQGWTVEETLNHLSEKAGLKSDDWKTGCAFQTFTAQVFGEKFRDLSVE